MSAQNGNSQFSHSTSSNESEALVDKHQQSINGSAPPANGAGGYKPTTEPVWLGIASPKPKSRSLGATLFGHVDDAFDSKSIKIGEETPFARRERIKDEARAHKELEEKQIQERKTREKEEAKRKLEEEIEKLEIEKKALKSMDNFSCVTTEDEKDLPKILIRGGRVVNDDQSFVADVFVVGKKIKLIGENLQAPEDAKIIQAENCLVMPGGIDTNTQFDATRLGVRSVDDFYAGTKAALSGGTTMIIDCVSMEINAPASPKEENDLIKSYELRRETADSSVCCDYSLCVEITEWNEAVEKSMEVLCTEKGVNCFRVNPSSLPDGSLFQFFKKCGHLGAIAQIIPTSTSLNKQIEQDLLQHGLTGPEGYSMSRPEEIEGVAVNRAILFADQADVPVYIGSVTGKSSADLVSRHRRRGKAVFGEACCAALTQNTNVSPYDDNSWIQAASHVLDPPLRPNTSSTFINHLSVGGLQVVGSTHCAFSAEQKAMGKDDFRLIPPGVNGVAERLPVVWNEAVVKGGMDPCRFVAITSSNAAKIFNIYPSKGRIAVGSDADLSVWDPESEIVISKVGHASSSDLNVFDGIKIKGSPNTVIRGGTVVLEPETGLSVTKGQGQFIATTCNSEYVYGRIRSRQQVALQNQLGVERDLQALSLSEKSLENQQTITSSSQKMKDTSRDDDHLNKYHCRPATSSGGRNMQDTTFTLSATSYCARLDDKPGKKGCGYKVNQPPGGSTTQLW